MGEEFLNQDEINALLGGGGGFGGGLSDEDKEALSNVTKIFGDSASNVVGMLAGRGVTAEQQDQLVIAQSETASNVGAGKIFVYSMDVSGIGAPARLLTTERGALTLADLMMGGDGTDLPEEANDLFLSASQEGLSQVVGSALTPLAGMLAGLKLAAENTSSSLEDGEVWIPFADQPGDSQVWLGRISITVDGVEPFPIDITMPMDNATDVAAKIKDAMKPEEEEPPAPAPAPAASAPAGVPAAPAPAAPMGGGGFAMPQRPAGPPVDARPVEFAQLGGAGFEGMPANIDLIVDIPVRVTVELGRTRKTIGEVLALGPGSVVELSKMAGEPVDVLVNGKLIARGEVVVIDESFGIRVTEVVSRTERIRSMGV